MKRTKGTTAAGVAVVLVLTACGGASISDTTEALLPIATSPTLSEAPGTTIGGSRASGLSDMQQSTVEQLISAYDAGDVDALLSLWTDGGSHYRWDIEFDIEMGGRWSGVDCAVSSGGQPRCDLMYTNDLLEALEAPPLAGYFRLDLSDEGLIARWDYDTGNRATAAAYLQPFSDWVEATDPDAADVMFDWNGFRFRTVESYALWTVKVEEYLAALG